MDKGTLADPNVLRGVLKVETTDKGTLKEGLETQIHSVIVKKVLLVHEHPVAAATFSQISKNFWTLLYFGLVQSFSWFHPVDFSLWILKRLLEF